MSLEVMEVMVRQREGVRIGGRLISMSLVRSWCLLCAFVNTLLWYNAIIAFSPKSIIIILSNPSIPYYQTRTQSGPGYYSALGLRLLQTLRCVDDGLTDSVSKFLGALRTPIPSNLKQQILAVTRQGKRHVLW